MNEQTTKAKDSEILQILITEHTNLQAVRSATVFEANGRTSLFLGAVSSSLIALAFIGQASEMGSAFFLFALILLPSLMFMGWVTFLRVNQTGIEDMMASRGINRIHHYYAEIAPLAGNYFIFSTHDDVPGFFQNFGAPSSFFQHFVATAGLVGVINSVLTAAFAGLLTFSLFHASLLVCVITSIVIFAFSVALYARHQQRYFEKNEKHVRVLFPSQNEHRI
ncbi:MAG: hypothetical protein H7Y09_07395 [Chitinophagaceae bacterium]|nr:hypothetical protein [Anaerolineae bacterium]